MSDISSVSAVVSSVVSSVSAVVSAVVVSAAVSAAAVVSAEVCVVVSEVPPHAVSPNIAAQIITAPIFLSIFIISLLSFVYLHCLFVYTAEFNFLRVRPSALPQDGRTVHFPRGLRDPLSR